MKSLKYSSPPHLKLNQISHLLHTTPSMLAALILSATSALAFTNHLANPGLETGTRVPWLQYGDWDGSYAIDSTNAWVYNSGDTIHAPSHSGQYVLKQWGTFWGAFTSSHTMSQYIPAAANSTWSADVWVYSATPDNLQSGNLAQLQVTFCDATTNVLSEVFCSEPFGTNSPVNTWVHLVATNSVDGSTNLTAPDGTAFVRFALLFYQDANYPGGSVYWDDANLIKTSASDPEISSPPHDLTVIYGQTATFNVIASGKTPLSYKWQKDGSDLSNGGRISGATTAMLTISNATTADQGSYSVTVTDNAGSLPSASGFLTVLDPGILANPVNLQRIEGQSATFTVVAAGSGTLTYDWYKGSVQLSNGGRISGANTASLTISNLTAADTDNYYVVVTGTGANTATSTSAQLYVTTLAQASNLIRNGDFESDLTYWTTWNGRGIVDVTTLGTGETNYSGSKTCEIWGTGNGTWNGINQGFPTVPGNVYKADAWVLVSTGTPIAGASEAWLEVNFYANGNMISSVQSPHITSNWVAGVWTNLVVPYAVAPVGADETRCQINYHALDGGGAVFVDNMSFWLKIPVTITPSAGSSNMFLSFPTQTGVSYQILYKDDLNDAGWQVLKTVTGDLSGKTNVSASLGTEKRFYQVITQ